MQAHCLNVMAPWWCGKWKMSRDDKTKNAIADCRPADTAPPTNQPYFPFSHFKFSSADLWRIFGQCATPFTIHFIRIIFSFAIFFFFRRCFTGSPRVHRLSSLIILIHIQWYYVFALNIANWLRTSRSACACAHASSLANAFLNDRRNNHNDKISMKNMLMKWHRFNI